MSRSEFDLLVQRHRRFGILVDTNLLLLLWIGRWKPTEISRHNRTSAFTSAEFELLEKLLNLFSRVVVTPCILTEASNLAAQLQNSRDRKHNKNEAIRRLRTRIATEINSLDERYLPSIEVAAHLDFSRFGLTDIGVQMIAHDELLVLTDDLDLYLLLAEHNVSVVNFNHIKHWAADAE